MRNSRPVSVDDFIAVARTWLGVPFQHQGRTRNGVDCAGFIICTSHEAGIVPPDYWEPRGYSRRPTGELRGVVQRYCTRTHRAVAGCLVLVQWAADPDPRHVALCTGPTLIHAYENAGGVVENSYRGIWKRDTHSVWTLPNVDYPEQR